MVHELKKGAVGVLGGLLACGAFALSPAEAEAQEAEDVGQVSGTAKGIVGGGLLGAEIVMIPMGAAGLKPWWPYVVFGAVGAAGGAVGGWAVEQADPPAEAPLYMLAGGLALIIPTLVLTLNATTKDSFEDQPTDAQPTDTTTPATPPPGDGTTPPPGDGTQPGGDDKTIKIQSDARKYMKKRRTAGTRPQVPVALFDISEREVKMGVPAFVVRNVYTEQQVIMFGVEQQTEVTIPVFGAGF